MNKAQLRQQLKKVLKVISGRKLRSENLVDVVIDEGLLDDVLFVSVFSSLPDEVDTLPLVQECWKRGIKVCVPIFDRMMKDKPDTLREWVFDASLTETHYGVQMPEFGPTHKIQEMDLILVPGMGFTEEGHRIGRGKGFYDRFLSGFTGKKVGIAFKEQLLEKLPVEGHDIILDQVITV